jgi:hypothetical protein
MFFNILQEAKYFVIAEAVTMYVILKASDWTITFFNIKHHILSFVHPRYRRHMCMYSMQHVYTILAEVHFITQSTNFNKNKYFYP